MVSKIAKVIIMNSFNIGVIEYGTKFRIQRTLIEYGPERLLEYDTFAPIVWKARSAQEAKSRLPHPTHPLSPHR